MSEILSSAETAPGPAIASALSGTLFGLTGDDGGDFDGSGLLSGLGKANDLLNSLLALLEALGWQGAPYQVAEALPHFADNFDITSFRNVLAALGFESRRMTMRLAEIAPEHTPCLFLANGRDAMVLVAMEPDGEDGAYSLEAFDSAEQRYIAMPTENLGERSMSSLPSLPVWARRAGKRKTGSGLSVNASTGSSGKASASPLPLI